MAKARREIQKAYRERRKLRDTNYLNKERQRQTKYRKPRSTLSKTVKNKLREQTRRYTAKYRQKLKVSREAEAQTNEIQTSEVLVNAVTPSTSDLNPSKGSALSTPRCTTRSSSASSGEQLVVRCDFGSYARKRLAKRKRSQCLAEARKKIRYLETSLRTANRRKKVLQKRVERLRIQKQVPVQDYDVLTLTPKSKTKQDLRKSGISPRKLPKKLFKNMMLANVLFHEVKSKKQKIKEQKKREVIHRVLVGKIIRKYRMKAALKTECSLSTRLINKVSNSDDHIMVSNRRRVGVARATVALVNDFFNSDEVSRMMPGKADATRVTKGQKVQTRIQNDYLSNCYTSFKYKYPSVQLSFSQFCKLRPSHVRLTKFLSRNSCLCAKHQNMVLKLKALKSLSVNPEHIN